MHTAATHSATASDRTSGGSVDAGGVDLARLLLPAERGLGGLLAAGAAVAVTAGSELTDGDSGVSLGCEPVASSVGVIAFVPPVSYAARLSIGLCAAASLEVTSRSQSSANRIPARAAAFGTRL